MYKFIALALFLLPGVTVAQSFTIASDPTLTNIAKQYFPNAQCGNGVCSNMRQDCQVSTMFTRQIVNGTSGLDVVSLQDFLVKLGFLVMPKNAQYGTFGPLTSAALGKYQKTNNLLQTGVVDDVTKTHLNNLVFLGKACYEYYRADQLEVFIAKTFATKTLAQDLNTNGYRSVTGGLFCANGIKNQCTNLVAKNSIRISVSPKFGVVKSATYFKSQQSNFTDVKYIKLQKNDIVYKSPVYSTSTVQIISTSTVSANIISGYNYSFTASSTVGTVSEEREIEALLSINKVLIDTKLYGYWRLYKMNGIEYKSNTEGEIVLSVLDSPKKIEIVGCGNIAGVMHGTVGAIRLEQAQINLTQCQSQSRVLHQGELYQSLIKGVRFTATESKLVLTSGKGTVMEFLKI